ncbi:MAG: hypothetical protein D6689_06740 [Deltaproteobacteria bacterium]|nr:MAG: hypothetical protein D6689_06740 [Deltaproteobacteria bacterium]
MTDYRAADLPPRARAMLDFAIAITDDPHASTPERIDALRAAGLTDEDILNVVQVTGFFNYYNLMVEALGVDPEPDWPAR